MKKLQKLFLFQAQATGQVGKMLEFKINGSQQGKSQMKSNELKLNTN